MKIPDIQVMVPSVHSKLNDIYAMMPISKMHVMRLNLVDAFFVAGLSSASCDLSTCSMPSFMSLPRLIVDGRHHVLEFDCGAFGAGTAVVNIVSPNSYGMRYGYSPIEYSKKLDDWQWADLFMCFAGMCNEAHKPLMMRNLDDGHKTIVMDDFKTFEELAVWTDLICCSSFMKNENDENERILC